MFPNNKFETLFDALRYRTETPTWMLWGMALFLITIVSLLYLGWHRQRRRDLLYQFHVFEQLAQEKGLTHEETQWLWHLAQSHARPFLVLTSLTTFDQVISGITPDAFSENHLLILRHKLGFDTLPLGWALTHTRYIPVGQRLWVGFKTNGKTPFFRCVLIDTTPKGLHIAPLTKTDQDMLQDLHEDGPVYIRFWRRGDSEYQFKTRLLPHSDSNQTHLWLSHTDAVKRLQHRDFFRMPVHIPVVIHQSNSLENHPPDILRTQHCHPLMQGWITDLSAGGVALLTPKPIPFGSHVWFAPIGESPFALFGVSGRVRDVASDGKTHYRHRLEFTNLNDALQDKLARQIHHAQFSVETASLTPEVALLSHT